MNYAIIGLGFISQKHIEAIEVTGGKLLMACDIDELKHSKVECDCFYDWKMMFYSGYFKNVDIVSICTPNYLHYEMIMEVRKKGKIIICEKPLVLNFNHLISISNNVNVVMQLRYSPILDEIRKSIKKNYNFIELKIDIHRGEWYFKTWKNDKVQSGGLLMNIGIHYFDLLQLLFGDLEIHVSNCKEKQAFGILVNNNSEIRYNISLNAPMDNQRRQLIVNGNKFNLSREFDNLHTKVYEDVLSGGGIKPSEAYKSIWLTKKLQDLGDSNL